MRNINKAILVGNVTRDPEIRVTISNQKITLFGLATNREWVTVDGRNQQNAEFHEIVCFGGLAEFASKTIKKGKSVYIEGRLKTRSWDDSAGTKKFRTEIVVEDLILLDKRPKPEIAAAAADFQPTVTIENPLSI